MMASRVMFAIVLTFLFSFFTTQAQAQLTVYSNYNYEGSSMTCGVYTYYKASQLESLNDNISSFKLSKGYMATFAVDELGTGGSKCYVAQDRDINISQLPSNLNDKVSLVRVFPWRNTTKKGWCGGESQASELNCSWRYDWDNVSTSTSIEYVPMRHNLNWNAYANINNKQGSTHVLSFNEPDRPDQANLTVAQVWTQWHRFEESGLRIGSPAPSDGGLSWLYQFFNELGPDRRCDVAAIHMYKGGWNGATLNNWLNDISNQTGRKVWVTEWNNGCNWTCCEPADSTEQRDVIRDMINYMNSNNNVERYAFYNWCSGRELWTDDVLNVAGVYYRDMTAPVAYRQETYPYEGSGENTYQVELESLSGQSSFSPFEVQSDSSASGGQYIVWPGSGGYLSSPSDSASGRVVINFNLSQSANVVFDIQVKMPANTDDSFYYKLDSGSWNTQNNTQFSSWGTLNPATFNSLSAGNHTLQILRREDGAQLDWAMLTASAGTISSSSSSGGGVTGEKKIISRASGKALDAGGNSDGANVQIWSYWGGANQKWTVTDIGSDRYSIRSLQSGARGLDYGWTAENGANVVIWSYWGGDPQKWQIQDIGDGYYRINAHANTGYCLDTGTSNGSNAGLWSYWGGSNQQWQILNP